MKIRGWKKKAALAASLLCAAVIVIDSFDLGVLEERRLAEEVQRQSQEQATEMAAEQIPSHIAKQAPAVSAKTAVVIEQNSGRVLYAKDKDEKIYPASTTKIMTALLALENSPLSQKVKVTATALKTEGSAIYLQEGEEISMEDLLYGLMLRSGNDAALAIAEGVSGSVEDFVSLMNKRAAEIGAVHTQFVNPNGLHNENHYTTAYDMALIAREAMKIPEFRTIAAAKSWDAHREAGLFNRFYNKNKVVNQYEGGTGIKIGYTKATGRTLVASSSRDGMDLICVVMNAPNWFEDSYKLMDFVYSNYTMTKIAQGQQPLKRVSVSGGEKEFAAVGPRENVVCPVERRTGTEGGEDGEASRISIQYEIREECKAPVRRWQKAGELRVFVDGDFVYGAPLYYMEDIEKSHSKSVTKQ